MNSPSRLLPVPVVLFVCVWFLFIICAFNNVGVHIFTFIVSTYGSLLWGTVWFVRLIRAYARRSSPRQPFLRAILYWGFEPVAWLLSVTLAFSSVLCLLRFRASRPELDSYVAAVIAGHALPHGNGAPRHWVGLFQVARTELLPKGIVRIITSPDYLNEAGFAYSPVSPPPVVGRDHYEYITGSWYYWCREL